MTRTRCRTQMLKLAAALALGVAGHVALAQQQVSMASLADLSLEQLSNIEVTSVAGRAESLQDAASSIYVITGDEIRRSAATSLPEALRLAPNLQVARLNAAQYSISARGFNNAIGNKLLVLIDGRTVYSPLFSGVFWDANDVVLEDVDRIEVISGPGGTLWGANAVNGVINVITRPAAATQGALASVARSGAGGYEMARWGGALGEVGHYRLYALAMDHDNTSRADGLRRPDAASKRQVGFRSDWNAGAGRVTVQGDAYTGGEYPANNLAPRLSGANLLARWTGSFANGSPFKLQAYVDRSRRDDVTGFRDDSTTTDLQFSHEPVIAAGQQLLWGAGYRRTRAMNEASPAIAFLPARKTLDWANVFVQHDLNISEKLQLTLGAKAERNDYTGVEFLPNARLSYKHSPSAMTWAAASRAVRAPARLDREFFAPGTPPFVINGGPAFESEIAKVLEIGHRGYAAPGITYSATLFHQHYDGLRSGSLAPVTLVNQIEGSTGGVEAWASWQASAAWRLSAGLLELRKHLHSTRAVPDPGGVANLGNDPRRQWSLRSSLNLGRRGEFDFMLRHVGALPSPAVESYTAVDARLALNVTQQLELSLLAQNLFDRRHVEFNAVSAASQIERRVFIKALWRL
jgi:iron complex outermembrane receptor protein